MASSSKRSKIVLAAILFTVLAVVTVIVVATKDDEARISTDTSVKPVFEPPSGEPPAELVINDVVEGDGAPAKAGDQITVQYVGIDYETGEQFDASWDSGQPFPLQLGAGSVISGWDEGIEGMKVGGRRELVIPPDLAYGAQGQPPDIAPNATLVFVIDLLDVQEGAPAGATPTPSIVTIATIVTTTAVAGGRSRGVIDERHRPSRVRSSDVDPAGDAQHHLRHRRLG